MGTSLLTTVHIRPTMSRALSLSCLLLLLQSSQARQVRSAPGLVSRESILPHTSNLWKKGSVFLSAIPPLSPLLGLCERVARQTEAGEAPECQPIGSKVDCGCEPSKWLVQGKQCAVWICGDKPSAFDPIGHWRCMGYC